MNSHPEIAGDTAKDFLQQIAADRGDILTDEDYADFRNHQLQALAHPPKLEWLVAGPGLVCIAAGVGLLIWTVVTWVRAPADSTMDRMMIGLIFTGLGSFFFFGNLRVCQKARRRSRAERLAEIDELLKDGLISVEEHEAIRYGIDMS